MKVQVKMAKIGKMEEEVPPGSTIVVKKNTFTKDIAPTVAIVGLVAVLGIVSTTLSIIKDVRSIGVAHESSV